MEWFTYKIGPIDFGFGHMKTVAETAKEIGKIEAVTRVDTVLRGHPDGSSGGEYPALDDFLRILASARAAAGVRLEDLRQEPVVFWIPMENDFDCGFVFKEDDNGTTYVVSPIPLPHLDKLTY